MKNLFVMMNLSIWKCWHFVIKFISIQRRYFNSCEIKFKSQLVKKWIKTAWLKKQISKNHSFLEPKLFNKLFKSFVHESRSPERLQFCQYFLSVLFLDPREKVDFKLFRDFVILRFYFDKFRQEEELLKDLNWNGCSK